MVVTTVALGIGVVALGVGLGVTINSIKGKNAQIETLNRKCTRQFDDMEKAVKYSSLASAQNVKLTKDVSALEKLNTKLEETAEELRYALRKANQRDSKGRMLPIGTNPDGSKV